MKRFTDLESKSTRPDNRQPHNVPYCKLIAIPSPSSIICTDSIDYYCSNNFIITNGNSLPMPSCSPGDDRVFGRHRAAISGRHGGRRILFGHFQQFFFLAAALVLLIDFQRNSNINFKRSQILKEYFVFKEELFYKSLTFPNSSCLISLCTF